MVGSFLRVVLFLVLVAGLTLGAGLMLDRGEGVRIAVAGWEFTLGPLQTLIAVAVLLVLVWLLLRILGLLGAVFRFLNGDETAISRYFDRNRERKGFQALSDAMLALASGEERLALQRAERADRYLARPELTALVVAQAAEAAGDRAKALAIYKSLLGDEVTRFVGVRGILRQKLVEGDTATALKLAEAAFAMKPRHGETQDILLKLQAEAEDWGGARKTLAAKHRTGQVPRDLFRRRDAVLALQEAQAIMAEGSSIEAREAAIAANKSSPDLIPAATLAARALTEKGDRKGATRILRRAWDVRPHPDLAAAFADIAPDETPAERLKRFRPLIQAHPDHEDTRLMLAELQLAAEDFPAARKALGDLVERAPTRRSLTVMAAVERGSGAEDSVVRAWLARALNAPTGPQWCCDTCETGHRDWRPVCSRCGGFDTLSWRAPKGDQATAGDAALLPLIIGATAAGPAASDEPAAEVMEAELSEPPVPPPDPHSDPDLGRPL